MGERGGGGLVLRRRGVGGKRGMIGWKQGRVTRGVGLMVG